MKISIVSRGDSSSGGAGVVAETLADGLRKKGITVFYFVQRPPLECNIRKTIYLRGIKGDILLRNILCFDIAGLKLLFRKEIWNSDIIHFHDFSVAYGPIIVFILSLFKKVVLTFHDFSGFTGGCINPIKCNNFNKKCKKCPQIGTSPLTFPFFHYPYIQFIIKRIIYKSSNVVVISPSHYLKNLAQTCLGNSNKINVIANGTNFSELTKISVDNARASLNLNNSDIALLFIASDIEDIKKGFFDIFDIFQSMHDSDERLKLLLVGKLSNKLSNKIKKASTQITYLGKIYDKQKLYRIIAGCDFLLVPSIADNMPCVISESLIIGTPCIAYNTGAITEMVSNIPQCHIVPKGNKELLKRAIIEGVKSKKRAENSIIRKIAYQRFSLNLFLERHLELYSSFK